MGCHVCCHSHGLSSEQTKLVDQAHHDASGDCSMSFSFAKLVASIRWNVAHCHSMIGHVVFKLVAPDAAFSVGQDLLRSAKKLKPTIFKSRNQNIGLSTAQPGENLVGGHVVDLVEKNMGLA